MPTVERAVAKRAVHELARHGVISSYTGPDADRVEDILVETFLEQGSLSSILDEKDARISVLEDEADRLVVETVRLRRVVRHAIDVLKEGE